MKQRTIRDRLLLGTIISGAVLIAAAAPALAQTAPEDAGANGAAETGNQVSEVVVTGSRIRSSNLTSASPVNVIGSQELTLTPTPDIESVLRNFSFAAGDGDNGTVNNGSTGIQTVDLRGLGDQRTLVLVDGKRLVPANKYDEVDLSQIPVAIVDRVEVLTGGASSTYGGDAVSGVVNVLLKKNFEGVQVGAQASVSSHGDGETYTNNIIMGVNSANGKGNLTAYGTYIKREEVFQGDRAYSRYALASPDYTGCASDASFYGGFCHSGSGGIAEGRDTITGTFFTNDRTLEPYDGRTYNFNPINYLQTPNSRFNAGAYGHYEVNPAFDVYGRMMFTDSTTHEQLASTPIQQSFQVNCGNPLLSDQERGVLFTNVAGALTGAGACVDPDKTTTILLRRRLVENGARAETDEHTAYQLVVGAKGDLGHSWSYDASAQYGRTHWSQRLTGDASAAKFQNGLLVNADGTCQSGGSCVPIDIFGGAGALTQDMVDYFTLGLEAIGETKQYDVQASITGNLPIKSPLANDPFAMAFGLEYRRESASFSPDDNLASGNLLGFSATKAVAGSFNVHEAFAELRAPIIQDKPFAQLLEVDAGYRLSDYSTSGNETTWKVAFQYAPVRDITLRGSFNQAIRDPNINELYSPGDVSADTGVDPCFTNGGVSATATAAMCAATGVPAEYYNTATGDGQGQLNGIRQGSQTAGITLNPEKAKTYSIGLVLTPTWNVLRGLTGSVDYYDTKIDDAIDFIPLQEVLDLCYSGSASNKYCGLIHRDAQGTLLTTGYGVGEPFSNIGSLSSRGIDVVLDYRQPLSRLGLSDNFGSIDLNLNGTRTTKAGHVPGKGEDYVNCLAKYGPTCGSPVPKWKHTSRLTWSSNGGVFSISGRWRFIGQSFFDAITEKSEDPLDYKIKAQSYFDFTGSWKVTDTTVLNVGVNNAFDNAPPIIDYNAASASVDSGNTIPGVYDTLGRVFFVGLTKQF